ncbi:Fungalysin metallopeptidase-domain-containing protein [Mycena haematopus]|nr:Fungalysin metallopeptidase-domain-containing protein [Mycena haematopus]
MVAFNKFFTSVFLAIVYASSSAALTVPIDSKHTTHRVRSISNNVEIEVYHPESTYQTFGTGIDHPLRKRGANLKEASESFISSHLGVDSLYHNGFSGDVTSHAYAHQVINGLIVSNAVSNVAFNSDDKVVAVGIFISKVASATPSVSFDDAKTTAESALDGTYVSEIPSTIEYLAKDTGEVVLVHVLQIRNEAAGTWYNAFINAHTNTLESITDYVAQATTQYRVLPITKETLLDGFEDVVDPADPVASRTDGTLTEPPTPPTPHLHDEDLARDRRRSRVRVRPGPTVAPTTTVNVNAARVNNFYLGMAYGGRFQNNNFGLGGKAGDRVTASIQDAAGTNNADFATPPDGQSGHMRMYLFTSTTPNRDGALENDVPVHENTHGVTNRLTGGGTGACLQSTEAGGMGGRMDWTEKTSAAVPDYVMGQYIVNSAAGIRNHPYLTNSTINPLTYASVKTLNEVHNIGEVWANLLHNIYAALVAQYGWSPDSRTNPDGTEGNIVHMHLFIDALPLQPCNPTFLTARDAWLQADVNRYGGANRCLLWKVYASKGLGVNAANHVNNADIPSDC